MHKTNGTKKSARGGGKKNIQSSHRTFLLIYCLIYMRKRTIGVMMPRYATKKMRVIYPQLGGWVKLDVTPGGGVVGLTDFLCSTLFEEEGKIMSSFFQEDEGSKIAMGTCNH